MSSVSKIAMHLIVALLVLTLQLARASTGVGLTLLPETLTCIINASTPGTAGNVFGFEDGSIRLVNGTFHMLVSEEYAVPKWVGMRLAHWVSDFPLGNAGWTRVGTLILDGKEMVSTENCSDARDHTAALWSPVAFFDDVVGSWFLTYVGYDCPGNVDGVIRLARSTSGDIGGPFTSAGTLLARNGSAQPWEGAQGDDSFFAYRPPGSSGGGGELLALFGSSDASSYWSVGLASSVSGTVAGPWTRAPAGNPLPVNGQRMENPIILEVPAPSSAAPAAGGAPTLLLAVFDQIGEEGEGFGLTWSLDGKGERSRVRRHSPPTHPLLAWSPPNTVWAPGQSVAVPGGVRAPMGALLTADNVVSVWFNRQGTTYDSLWVAQFALGPAPPFVPPDSTPLTLKPCEAGAPQQAFTVGTNGTLRLVSAPNTCVDLNGCDTTTGVMDVWTCHVPGDACGGAFPSDPAINQRFSVNANGTISYTDAPAFCLTAASPQHAWLATSVVLQECLPGSENQTWRIVGDVTSDFSIVAQQSGACVNVG